MQQGIEQALAELFRRYYAPLYMKAYKRIPSAGQVEEMVQDVFVNIWVKAPTLDTDSNVKAYLYATLRNKILNELRTEAIHSFHAANFATTLRFEDDTSSADILHAKLTEQYLSKVIAGLSPHCREAFLLSRTEHLTYREIAQRMDISVSTVEKHVTKALQILRRKLNEYDDLVLVALITILLRP